MDNKKPYLQPAGWVALLYRHHMGGEEISIERPSDLDLTASRKDDKIYIRATNVSMDKPVRASIETGGMSIEGGTAYEISADPQLEITELIHGAFRPVAKKMEGTVWEFPPDSITDIELKLKETVTGVDSE